MSTAARPVVLLHGQPGSAADWGAVVPHLPDLRLLVPDRLGYDGHPAGGFAANASALARSLRDQGVPRAVLVGHSWGGGVALQTARDHPELVAGVCLLGSVGSPLAVTLVDRVLALPWLRIVAGAAVCCSAALAPRVVARTTGSVLVAAQRTTLRAAGRRWLVRGGVSAYAVEQRALVTATPSLCAGLGSVTVPCLVVSGRADRSVPVAAAVDLVDRLPDAELLLVDGGHLLPLEAPEAVAAAVRRTVAGAQW